LIATPQNIDHGIKLHDYAEFFKKGRYCPPVGMQLVQTNLIIVEHFPHELLKKEGVSH
jgi:hypothetical protein